jgi:hypothetical protein
MSHYFKKVFVLFLTVFLFGTPVRITAHGAKPIFILINGESVKGNSIADDTYFVHFTIGETNAPKPYVANDLIRFSLDGRFFKKDVLRSLKNDETATWDFGDGSESASGTSVSHAYAQPGTYIVTVKPSPSLMVTLLTSSTVQVTVVPELLYTVPQAKFSVNGIQVDDPFEIIEIKPRKKITFDASASVGEDVRIIWDFGDESKSEEMSTQYAYPKDTYFPVVAGIRVIDRNNIASDAFVTLDVPYRSTNPIVALFETVRNFILDILGT